MKTVIKYLALGTLCLGLGLTGASAQSSNQDTGSQLRALLSMLQSPTGSFLAGEEALQQLDTLHATELFSSASVQEPDNTFLTLRTFHAQAAHGRIEEAARTAKHLLELVPQDEMSSVVLGAVALKQRQYKEAVNALEGVAPHSIVGITASLLKSWALVGDNRYVEATAIIDELAASGIEGFLTYPRALMADVADKKQDALAFAEEAYQSEPYDVRFIASYARMLANNSQFAEAQNVVRTYRDQGLLDPSVLALEEDLMAGRRPGKLAPTAQAGAAEIFNSLGSALANDGSGDLAAIYLRLATYLAPDLDIAAMELGGLYDRFGQHDLADKIYTEIAVDSPYRAEADVRMIRNVASAGDEDKAIEMLHDAVVRNPDDFAAASAWADMLRSEERWTEAARAYTLVIGLIGGDRPQDWRYFYLRGMCYERAKKWESAEADFQRALELDPDNPQVLNYLGYSWIDQGIHLDKALEMIKTALEWDPSDGYVVDSLGWAYYRLGRYEDAVQTLEQAVQLRASDVAINDHLGDAYWQTGRKLEARFQWTIASDLEPKSEIGMAARAKLDTGLVDGDPENNG